MKQLNLLFIFLLSINCFSQIDTSGKPISVGSSFGISKSTKESPFSISKKDPLEEIPESAPLEKEKKTLDMAKQYGFVKKTYNIQPNFLSQEREMREEFKRNQYFGDFKSKTKFIQILCRDHEYVDDDMVSIIHNGKVFYANIYLGENFKKFYIDLIPGFNHIEFVALNQGTSGPNTAQFVILDEFDNPIISNIWNLATGVKASLIIVQE